MGLDPDDLEAEIQDKDSEIYALYHREILFKRSEYNATLIENAKDGNEAAIRELAELKKQNVINEIFKL